MQVSPEVEGLFEGHPDGIAVVDASECHITAVNDHCAELLGLSPEALRGQPPTAFGPDGWTPDPSFEALVEQAARRRVTFEWCVEAPDGETRSFDCSMHRPEEAPEYALVTVRERAERDHRLRTVRRAVEQAGHAVYVTDTDGTIEYVNPTFEAVTGYEEDEAVGATPAILNSGVESDAYYERLWTTILDGEVWEEEIENERADGTRYVAEQTISPVEVDGEVERFVAIQRDVTEQREHERELERYRDLIENVPVGVYRNTPGVAGRFVEVNPAMVDLFDADSEDELLDTHVAELYATPGKRELVSRALEEQGSVAEKELRLQTLSDETFWGAVSAVRHELDGEVYYDGIITDITERRETARELRFRERRFRNLFENHESPMLLVDPETGAIERANDAAAAFYGHEKSTLTSMHIQDINQLPDEEVARRREQADSGETGRFVFPHELANGEVRTVEVDSTPIHTGDKRVLFSIVHDVTERERTRDRLERQNEQLEVLNRVVRHDIRNDMTVLLSHVEFLEDHVDETGAEYLETIAEHGDHVVELTDTVRDLMASMLDEDESGADRVGLARVLETEVEAAADGYPAATFSVTGSVPNVHVAGNEMLSSVFRNLLNNAVQHNDTDEPTVTVSAAETDDAVEVRVADDGPGVPDAQKEDIFGKGERGMDSPGTGLGLYLVHTFVDQFDGSVWVTDNEPRGSVFHVELPKAE